MTCCDCYYARQAADGLQCHRHAPAATAESVTVFPIGHHHPQAVWPIVSGGDWCGEFQVRSLTAPRLPLQQSDPFDDPLR